MATLDLDPASTAPPYEQVRLGVLDRVASGSLLPGDKLPAVRALAAELGLSAGTVARAYKELEEAGVLVTRGRNGTRVAFGIDPASLPTASGMDPAVVAFAADAVARARAQGLPLDQLAAAVRDEVARETEAD
jgi:GntR family transcriptional regulator